QAVELKGQAVELKGQAVELKLQSHEETAQQGSFPEIIGTEKPQSLVQQTLVDLIKVIGQKNSTAVSQDDINLQLNNLAQQLESTELKGEQVLAGIDLSTLVAGLDSFINADGGEEQITQLVAELEEQVSNETGLLKNAEMMVTAGIGAEQITQQMNRPTLKVETLAQARGILQSAIAAATTKNTMVAEDSLAEEAPVATGLLTADAGGEEIDPRFSRLLQGRTENSLVQPSKSLNEQLQQLNPKQQQGVEQKPADSATRILSDDQGELKAIFPEQQQSTTVKQMVDNFAHHAQRNMNPLGHQPTPGIQSNNVNLQTPTVQLPSGMQMPEGQILDQVVTQISGSFNGESGRMVLRLQPAELGSLKLELMVEGDRVRANVHAQSLQVQEVIERNLPQLRNALAEQGLKIDQFQVNIDQRQQAGQFENLAQQQQQQRFSQQHSWHQEQEQEEQMIPLAHLMQNGGGGINLHV
ncbi:MAG: flagellar hook-length control protein FliK, partial [Deltaproteobacteria bacterium]|nr:flagellar hook-length control protein FliK [Deltaproteobacteria bacterium]